MKMQKENKEKLKQLEIRIEEAVDSAISKIEHILNCIVMNSKSFKKDEINDASLKEIRELVKFYYSCRDATRANKVTEIKNNNKKLTTVQPTKNIKRSKLYKLSNVELHSSVVEKYIDNKTANLLYKYNKLVSSK